MKKIFSIIYAMLLSCAVFAQTNIDDALSNLARKFSESIPEGQVVAVLRISSPSDALSKYMLDNFTMYTVHLRRQTVVARSNLDMIAREMNFQLSGEVSDETMQQIGAKTGAQTIIFGEFSQLGAAYDIKMQAFDVTTAAIIDMQRETVSDDNTIAMITGQKIVDSSGRVKSNDYTTGQRIGIGFQNILAGLGSYMNGHWGDGLFMTVLDVGGIMLLATNDDPNSAVISIAPIMLCGSVIYGFVRPWFYHKEVKVGFDGKTDGLNIAFAPPKSVYTGTGAFVPAASVSYKISF